VRGPAGWKFWLALGGLCLVGLALRGAILEEFLRKNPVARVTIAGGVAKITKLAQGLLDLHSARGRVELGALADVARAAGGSDELAMRIVGCNTTAEALGLATESRVALGDAVAEGAWDVAADVLAGADIVLDIVIFDREGQLVGRSLPKAVAMKPVHAAPPKR
jgi:cobalt-precorrin-5B (C1)-methyltransferase